MKIWKIAKTLIFVAIALVLILSMTACTEEEKYYTRSEVQALISELELKISNSNAELDEKIAALENYYETKIMLLQSADFDNKAAIEALKIAYNEKVSELESKDKENADVLEALKLQHEIELAKLQNTDSDNEAAIETLKIAYNEKVSELESKDKENADALEELTAEYENEVAELNSLIIVNAAKINVLEEELSQKISEAVDDYNSKIFGINEIIEELRSADTSNIKRIAALEAQVALILSRHEHTFGDWIDYRGNGDISCEERFFFRICSDCDVVEWKLGAEHKKDALGRCIICKNTTYTVTFNSNGGSIVNPQNVIKNNLVSVPQEPTKQGYVFRGWILPDGSPWDFNTPVTKDIELKAKWLVACKVTFDTDGIGNIPSITLGKGEFVPKPSRMILGEKFEILAWYIAGTETEWNFEEMTATEDLVLVAELIIILPFAPSS